MFVNERQHQMSYEDLKSDKLSSYCKIASLKLAEDRNI